MNEKIDYLKRRNNTNMIKIELYFAPLLIILPFIVSILLIQDWFYRGFTAGISIYDGELLLGLIILFGNIIFDIPFIKSLKPLIRK
jgi:hypothetical protein